MMTETDYLEQRLESQQKWYSKESSKHKKKYTAMRSAVIVFSVMIPFFVGMMTDQLWPLKIAAGVLGLMVAILEGLLALGKHQEKWHAYRQTSEALKREKYLFLTKSGIYNNGAAFKILVENVETILSGESDAWSDYMQQETEDQF